MNRSKNLIVIIPALLIAIAAFVPALFGRYNPRISSPISIVAYTICVAVISLLGSHLLPNTHKYQKTTACLLTILFSQFITLGRYFAQYHNFLGCFSDKYECLIWVVQSIIYGYAIYKIILIIFAFFEEKHISIQQSTISLPRWFAIMFGVRILFLIAFYPCVFGFDAAVGLRTFLDPECATCSHHPFFIQLIHGLFYTLGEKIGHISVGFALLSLLLIACSCAIIIYGIKLLEFSNVKKRWIVAIALLYSILPIYPYLSIYPTKDGIFAYFFLLYLLTIYELFITIGRCLASRRFLTLHFVAGLIVCLSRHQGVIIFVIESGLLLFCYKHLWKKIISCTLPVLFLFFVFEKKIMPIYNVEPAGKQETYGPLFQQTAYCLIQHPEDITADERRIINRILNCDTIALKYEYAKTDAVKNTYKYNPWYRVTSKDPSMFRHIERVDETANLKAYQHVWLSMFLRHPLTHLEASAAVFFGFFYNLGQPLILTEPKWAENTNATTEKYRFYHINKIALIIQNKKEILTNTPILCWIGAVPYYNWLAILLFSILLYRRDRKGMVIFLPVLLSLGVLLICPIAFGRYTFPIVMALPILFVYLLSTHDKCQV